MAAKAVASRRTSRRTRGSRTTAEIANAIAKKPMKVWLVAPRPAMKKVSTNAAGRAIAVPASGGCQSRHQEHGVEGVDALDVGFAPEARREGEQERRHDRGDPIEAEPARQRVEAADRDARASGAHQAHAERDRSDRHQQRPQLAEQDVERIAGRVRDAERRHRRHQLAAVADVDGARGADGVEREQQQAEHDRLDPNRRQKSSIAQETQRVAVARTAGQQAVADRGVATRRRGLPDSAKFRETKG